jgi:anti-sigma B factor antagonist
MPGDPLSRGGFCACRQLVAARTFTMASYRHIEIHQVDEVTVVHFREPRVTDLALIEKLGQELYELVEKDNRIRLVLNFSAVEFLSSVALGKLISLNGKVKRHDGMLKLCSIRPEIYEAFAICKLDRVFDIRKDEADALAACS